jgi:hypothetical protein
MFLLAVHNTHQSNTPIHLTTIPLTIHLNPKIIKNLTAPILTKPILILNKLTNLKSHWEEHTI